MSKLLWLGRIGFLTLALVLLPAERHDALLSGSTLCASEAQACQVEVGSYCIYDGVVLSDHTSKSP